MARTGWDRIADVLNVTAAVSSECAALGRRQLDRIGGRGLYARPLDLERDKTVLLFFADVERDTFVKHDRHVRRLLRRYYHAFKKGQRVSGFGVAFMLLTRALESQGYRVVVNDRALARRMPQYPVGIAGYPQILDGWDLPNPAVLGPGLLDHPNLSPRLMEDPRFRSYIVPSEWMRAVFEKSYPGRCVLWYAGIDVQQWPDLGAEPKDVDVLVYEKILWDRARKEPAVLEPVLGELRRRGLRIEVLRYGRYLLEDYRALLRRSRSMLFLCEHETQGLAYQEAMASNVPILAWDQGLWLDPQRLRYETQPVRASSVPYFAPQCGETFTGVDDFPAILDRFLARLGSYTPRRYVADNLSLESSARRYWEAYVAAAK
jgi:hypothetical protein